MAESSTPSQLSEIYFLAAKPFAWFANAFFRNVLQRRRNDQVESVDYGTAIAIISARVSRTLGSFSKVPFNAAGSPSDND